MFSFDNIIQVRKNNVLWFDSCVDAAAEKNGHREDEEKRR